MTARDQELARELVGIDQVIRGFQKRHPSATEALALLVRARRVILDETALRHEAEKIGGTP